MRLPLPYRWSKNFHWLKRNNRLSTISHSDRLNYLLSLPLNEPSQTCTIATKVQLVFIKCKNTLKYFSKYL